MSDAQTKPKRRWFQFSLRTLLIVVTLSAVPLGWVGSKMAQQRREKAVIEWVINMKGRVYFYTPREKDSWQERIDAWFGVKVRRGNLVDAQVSDLSPLAVLTP